MFMESPRFPDDISSGVSFGPEFVTVIGRNQAGYEQPNQVYQRALGKGECAHAVRLPDQLTTLLTFFRSVGGRAHQWRFKDWSDYRLAAADSLLVPVSGAVSQYQVTKLYRAAVGFEEQRPIRKPVAGTLVLRDGVTVVAAGVGAGQYAFDTTTGIVTLVASQTRAVNAHVVGGAHKFTLASALSPNVGVGEYVAVSGVTGTAASLLNGLLLPVMAVSGADVTVGVNTAGLTASGGTLSLYRQAASMTAACEFDVPCRFDTDHMATSVQAYEIYSWNQIPIVEVRV